ncbi:hypothetical protein DFH08DRAFT_805244 [Mycena albidolilacea]|uniref:Uncharacterized protein n=1 Tax=Mycena albidolilacea TaxID=1033008 RepID=A0AAD7EWD6_9AGAR|nr:hypothetical protein DFH08DRAFT_805244 [Mycena albidolilacea]
MASSAAALLEHAQQHNRLRQENQTPATPSSPTTNIEERNALQFVHTLELKDMLAKSTEVRVENWAPSNKLAYYSSTAENAVIKAMWDSNIKELPAPGNFDCDTLTKFVAREFSIARYSMKKTMRPLDILEHWLTHATAVNATLGLYFRLAFITNHAANEFWTKVDDQLEELHSETLQEFVACMALELIYDDYIELYVTPVGSTFKTGDPVNDSSPQWLQSLLTAATQAQRVKKQGTKRKRWVQADDEEGEEPEMHEQEEPEENGNGAGGNNGDTDPK